MTSMVGLKLKGVNQQKGPRLEAVAFFMHFDLQCLSFYNSGGYTGIAAFYLQTIQIFLVFLL